MVKKKESKSLQPRKYEVKDTDSKDLPEKQHGTVNQQELSPNDREWPGVPSLEHFA